MQVKWGEIVSSQFSVSNGVKQVGVMSPVLFTIYLDNLLKNLRQRKIGCKIVQRIWEYSVMQMI